jgi:hypothetical protein
MTPLERLVTQALRLPIEIVQHIIKLNRDVAERVASTIFQKYTRGSRPRLAFRHMQVTLGGDNTLSVARWWRETRHPFYDSTIPLLPGSVPFPTTEARRQWVAEYRRRVRDSL